MILPTLLIGDLSLSSMNSNLLTNLSILLLIFIMLSLFFWMAQPAPRRYLAIHTEREGGQRSDPPKLAQDPWGFVKFESCGGAKPKDPARDLGEKLKVCYSARIPLPRSPKGPARDLGQSLNACYLVGLPRRSTIKLIFITVYYDKYVTVDSLRPSARLKFYCLPKAQWETWERAWTSVTRPGSPFDKS